MASFMSNFFPAGKEKAADALGRPATPTQSNTFIEPVSTPQGSPSKKTAPPGAYDLPTAFDTAMNLKSTGVEAPLKLTRPQSVITTPQSPGKTRSNPLDEASPNVDDSVIHKGPSSSSPVKKQGQENTPPAAARIAGTDSPAQHSHAALTRQQLYEPRERPTTPAAKRFNTTRPLSTEERELLNKPNVKRLVNVTQLCKSPIADKSTTPSTDLIRCRLPRLLFRSPHICRLKAE
jgi:cell cycle protein kinase DBF2